MQQLFIINHSNTDKYGDEYLINDFISAPSHQNAWFLAGANIVSGIVTCEHENYFSDGIETFSVEVWSHKEYAFWDVLDNLSGSECADNFMAWAVQNRQTAALLHDMAQKQDPPCQGLLDHAQFISLVEQYNIEQSILHKNTSAIGKKTSL